MKSTVIVQFIMQENNIDELFSFEESLMKGIEQSKTGILDGNDIGKETYNIYILPKGSYGPCVENIKMWLKAKKLTSKALIAHTTASGNIIVDYPEGYQGTFSYGI